MMIHLSSPTPAFEKARFQNNLYVAQECLRPDEVDADIKASKKREKLQSILKNIASTAAVPAGMSIQQHIQDEFAVEGMYLTIDEIDTYFIDQPTTGLKKNLYDADPSIMDKAWATVSLQMMQDAVQGYLGQKDADSHTKKLYEGLADHLTALDKKIKMSHLDIDKNKEKLETSNDLWQALKKGKVDPKNKDEPENDYMDTFAQKAGLTEEKIKHHATYLETEFFRLVDNAWWSAAGAQSVFRDKVASTNPLFHPQCLMRVSSAPRRGSVLHQPASKRRTMRIDLKNSPFDMYELAALLNAAADPLFADTVVGRDEPLSRLVGKENPFHDAVFKIGSSWYIIGGVTSPEGQFTAQKRLLTVQGGAPQKDATTGEYINISVAEKGSLLTTADMNDAKGLNDKEINLGKIVEDGVRKLINDCGYGLDNSTPAAPVNDEMTAFVETVAPDSSSANVFMMDDRPLLAQWLLTPQLNFNDPTFAAEVFGSDATVTSAQVDLIANARNQTFIYQKHEKLQLVFDYLHQHPSAYAALSRAVKAIPSTPADEMMAAFKARDAEALANLNPSRQDLYALQAMCWGNILARVMAMHEDYSAESVKKFVDAFNETIKSENEFLEKVSKDLPPMRILPMTGSLDELVKHVFRPSNVVQMRGAISRLFESERRVFEESKSLINDVDKLTFADFKAELMKKDINLAAAANIIFMPEYQFFTRADRAVVGAMAWTAVLDVFYDRLKKDPTPSARELFVAINEEVLNQKNQLGSCLSELMPLTNKVDDTQALLNAILNPLRKGFEAGAGTTAFVTQRAAIETILTSADALRNNPTLAVFQTSSFDNATFVAATLTPSMKELTRRRFDNLEVGVGWSLQEAKTNTGGTIYHAATSGPIDYLTVGMMQWRKEHPEADAALELTYDGKKIYFEQCATTPGQPASLASYQLTTEDASGGREVFVPKNREEGIKVRSILQASLLELSEVALKNPVLRENPLKDIVHVAPDLHDSSKAAITENGATAPSQEPPPASGARIRKK